MRLPNINPLESPRSSAVAGVDEVVKTNFDFVNGSNKPLPYQQDPMIMAKAYLDAHKQESAITNTAGTADVQPGLTKDEAKGQTIESLQAMYKPMPTMDQAEAQDAYGMINTPTPVMQDTTIDQWNPAYRNFAIGSAIGNLFNGRGLEGAIQQFGAFADTQQNQAQLAYQKQVAEAAQRRQTGLDKLKIIQDIYGTDRQAVNDFNDDITRRIGILQTAENKRLDNEAKMDRVMYQAESSMDRLLAKGELDAAQNKVTSESKLRSELFKIVTTGNREHYINAAKLLNELVPGLDLPTDKSRAWTQKELDLMSKIVYRDKILQPTIAGIEAGTNLKNEQAKQAAARTEFIKTQIRFYPAEKKADIAKVYAEIENMKTDNTLNQKKFDEQKKNMVTVLNQSLTVQRDILAKAEQRTKWLRDQIARVEEEFRGYATLTEDDKAQLQTLRNNLADAIIEQNKETQKYRDMPAQSAKILEDINSVGADAGLDINASSDELIGSGNARNR